jgi:hypothetical protein
MTNGLPSGRGMLILSFLITCVSASFSRDFGSLIAVRTLPLLALRGGEGVCGGPGDESPCFHERPSLDATSIGLVVVGLGGGSNPQASVGEGVDLTITEDAMVPPTPACDVAGMALSGAFLVMEHEVGGMLVIGVTKAGLCEEAGSVLKPRSDSVRNRTGVSAHVGECARWSTKTSAKGEDGGA